MFTITGKAIWYILKRVENKKVIVYGTGSCADELMKKLRCLDIEVAYYIDDEMQELMQNTEKEVRDIYALLLEKEEFYVFIAKKDKKCCAEHLEGMGLEHDTDFNYILNTELRHQFMEEASLDVSLGYTLPLGKTDGKGVKIFGDVQKAKYTLAILGNSTSDPCNYSWKSWGECFWEDHKDEWAVIVGAVVGYSSSEEVIKFIRDILPFHPDLVISYSGVNDSYQKSFTNGYQRIIYNKFSSLKLRDRYGNFNMSTDVFYGIENEVSYAENWINNQRIMHSVAESLGISYRAYFQPTLYTKRRGKRDNELYAHVIMNEQTFYDRVEYSRQVIEKLKDMKLDFIVDASHWFDDSDGVFSDHCHVDESGNRYIAEKVYEDIFGKKE